MKKTCLMIAVLVLFFCGSVRSQGVGIGTPNPKAKLHVAGNVRIDTATTLMSVKRLASLDSVGVVHSYPIDSLMGRSTTLTTYVQEVPAATSTTSSLPQVRVTLSRPPGTYLLFAYFEVYNLNIDAGVRGWVFEGATEIAFGIVYSNMSTYGSWSTQKLVSPTATTAYTLRYSSWPNGTTSNIRRARLFALKVG